MLTPQAREAEPHTQPQPASTKLPALELLHLLDCASPASLLMNSSSSRLPTSSSIRHDAEVIGLVGLAHGTSHFFHLMLPPLFPWLMKDFNLSYTEAGLLMTTFFVISGIGQALAGFIVDKVGSRPVLFFGIGLLAFSGVILGLSNSYAMLLLTAAVAGLGNSIFHPADFTLLNRRVAQPRLGHAFSVHGLSGNLGWAVGAGVHGRYCHHCGLAGSGICRRSGRGVVLCHPVLAALDAGERGGGVGRTEPRAGGERYVGRGHISLLFCARRRSGCASRSSFSQPQRSAFCRTIHRRFSAMSMACRSSWRPEV